jgi:hypothetical protein
LAAAKSETDKRPNPKETQNGETEKTQDNGTSGAAATKRVQGLTFAHVYE